MELGFSEAEIRENSEIEGMTEMELLSSRLSAVKKDGRKQSDSVEYHPIASLNLASFN